MLKTSVITKWIEDKLNELGKAKDYTFNLFAETGKIEGGALIYGRVHRQNSTLTPSAGLEENALSLGLELSVPCRQGSNNHVLVVSQILDDLVRGVNGTYLDIENGRAKIVIDGGIVNDRLTLKAELGSSVTMSTVFNITWTPNVIESDIPINENQIEIKLIQRTPYHNRTINIYEPDIEVFKLNTTIIGWQHDDVSAVLKMKLPVVFDAKYNYVQITEFSGKITRWFVLQRDFTEPNVWVHHLRRDLVREHWGKIAEAKCMIERGYLTSSNPLFYKSEGISGNLTLGKRSKLLDSNLMLAYVKTFNIQNNLGAAIPEGTWKVQGGMPGFGNAPIITDKIPKTISIVDGVNSATPNALLRMYCYMGISGQATIKRWIDSRGNWESKVDTQGSYFNGSGIGGSINASGTPNAITLNRVANSLQGYINFVANRDGVTLSSMPLWMFNTKGFGSDNSRNFPISYECVINKGTVNEPRYYKLIFTRNTISKDYNIVASANNYSEVSEFINYTGQAWSFANFNPSMNVIEGNITYHTYTIREEFLSNTITSEDACYTNFPATSIQTTAGAYSYNIYAFKVFDNGKGYKEDYIDTAQALSGQMIVSALMSTGLGEGEELDSEGNPVKIPSLAGQVVDIQMCPFDETSINNLIDTIYPIYRGSDTTIKIGEYYLLNSQDVEQLVNYHLTDWKSRGNIKSRATLSQMRLVCPNNSSIAILNPESMVNTNAIQFRMNGTLYPYKPIYKITPIAASNVIYASSDARDNMLVLGGDFSATQVSSSWSNYLIGNKGVEEAQQTSIANQVLNQQLQYDFQLKSIEAQKNISMNSSLLGMMGGLAGLSTGNPLMGILGLMGGGMGMMNTATNTQLQKEGLQVSQNIFNNNIALNQKLFNLQMGNIKSSPNTIHKITSGSFDNDYSAMIEEYYSTATEYEQFDRTIQKTGMTVNCIGKITDYIDPDYFVFAQMIECDVENFHVFNEINRELQNGLKINYLLPEENEDVG